MKLLVIACEVCFREVCAAVSTSAHRCDVVFLPKGLHDLGVEKMSRRLQAEIDKGREGGYDAVALAYGLCNNGVVDLKCEYARLVLPRAHDCITLFMGSRTRYRGYFDAHPGTYFRTTGWIEREDPASAGDETVMDRLGLGQSFAELVEKYGEENARYVMESMGDATANYDRLAYIRMGVCEEGGYEAGARREAQDKGWSFDLLEGSMGLFQRLVNGEWADDFLVLEPGERIAASYDEGVVRRGREPGGV